MIKSSAEPGAGPGDTARAAERLLRIVGALRARVCVPEADAIPVAAGIERFMRGEVADLARALGVGIEPGHRTWGTIAALGERDRQIIEIAALFFPGDSVAAQAEQIALAWARYEAGPWRFDRLHDDCPPRHKGHPQEYLFRAMHAHPGGALSAGRVRALLSAAARRLLVS